MSTKAKGEMALHPSPEGHEISGEHGRLHERLARGLLLADGATGTMLHAKGLQAGEPPELWNVTRPRVVQGVHKAYLAVGCDLVETNTFGANHLRLKESGLAGETAAINLRAVQLARKVCTAGHLVAGAVGPTGRFSKEKCTASVAEIVSAFKEQVSHLIQGGVDLILVETMTHLAEARMALQATRECPPVPVAVSLVFSEQRGGFCTLDGASPQEAVRELSAAQVVGCNCMDAEGMAEVLRAMREATSLPLIAQPHAGLPESREKKSVYPVDPEGLVRHIPSLLASKPGILGGCCGTTPAHLEAVIRSLRHP